MSGTVNIARDLFDHGVFKPEPFSEREAWIWMIMAARWKSGKARVGDFVVDLARGQFAASVRFMAKAWGWTAAKVQRLLERLKKMEMISSKTDTGVTVITVCNYDKFQQLQEATDTGPIQVRYKREEGCKKEVEGKVKEEAKASSKKRGSRLSDDWFLPMAWGQWAIAEGYSQEVVRIEAENFRDYWHSKAGAGATKLDWQATWRIWLRKASKGRSNGNGHHNGNAAATGRDRFLDEIAEVARARPAPRLVGG